MLSEKNVQIELFPLRKEKRALFNVTKFYQEIITFDPDEINETVLDSSSKILDLKERLRQKEFKKRTLNRLLMKIGNDTQVGVKLYALYTKAKRPTPRKVDARSNLYLQRVVKKINKDGKPMFEAQIGTYYPLGGEKVKFSKEDMNKVKNIEAPGMTLIGFKPKKLIKPYHNLRTSYFLYPDEDHVTGSSQFCDALINELT
jgi:ATP-dependent DNA helicase 2 subunit 1